MDYIIFFVKIYENLILLLTKFDEKSERNDYETQSISIGQVKPFSY